MNCQELKKEIEELKAKTAEFDAALAEADETNKGWNKVRAAKQACQELEDSLLGKYLREFKERNPELAKWKPGERIEGFGYEGVDMISGEAVISPLNVYSICQLNNGKVMIGGWGGALYEYNPETKKLGERIEGFKYERKNDNGEISKGSTTVRSICQLDNGKVLIGGDRGALYEYDPEAEEGQRLGKLIEGFESEHKNDKWEIAIRPDSVFSIHQLDNGKVLLGGGGGALYEYNPEAETKKLSNNERIKGFPGLVKSICQLDNGKVMIGGENGALYEYDPEAGTKELSDNERIKGFSGKYVFSICQLDNGKVMIDGSDGALYEYDPEVEEDQRLGERIEGFEGEYENYEGEIVKGTVDVNSICQLDDGKVMIGGDFGALYEYNPETKKLGERIEGFKDAENDTVYVRFIHQLDNGKVMIGGDVGALYEATPPFDSVSDLKQHLKDITAKKGE